MNFLPLQVGWNASVPQCVDSEPPTFHNCPTNPVYILTDDNGQLLPAIYEVPSAADNSGSVAYVRVTPDGFDPPKMISHDMDVIYTAFDDAGNTAECIVKLRIPGMIIFYVVVSKLYFCLTTASNSVFPLHSTHKMLVFTKFDLIAKQPYYAAIFLVVR